MGERLADAMWVEVDHREYRDRSLGRLLKSLEETCAESPGGEEAGSEDDGPPLDLRAILEQRRQEARDSNEPPTSKWVGEHPNRRFYVRRDIIEDLASAEELAPWMPGRVGK